MELPIGDTVALSGSSYDPYKELMVLIHGFGQNPLAMPFIFPASTAIRRLFAKLKKIPEPKFYLYSETEHMFNFLQCTVRWDTPTMLS